MQSSSISLSVRRLGGAYGSKISRNFVVAAGCALASNAVKRYDLSLKYEVWFLLLDNFHWCSKVWSHDAISIQLTIWFSHPICFLTKIIPFYMYHLSFKREVKKPIENLIASDFLSTFWGKSWYHNNLTIIVLIKCYMYNKIDCQVASCDHLNNQLSWTSCFEIGWKIISYVRPHLKIYIINLQNSGLELWVTNYMLYFLLIYFYFKLTQTSAPFVGLPC